ncbi:MAG: hypothetical protein KAV00_03520 [Phycisphaerae bacterium]|nr:hypothetical protein [Phycisphaerae bacterium]
MSRPAAILKITSRADADELIRDIRQAVRNSTRTGGGYGVYRRDDAGAYAVAIEVNIPASSPRGLRRGEPDPPIQVRKGLLWNSFSL